MTEAFHPGHLAVFPDWPHLHMYVYSQHYSHPLPLRSGLLSLLLLPLPPPPQMEMKMKLQESSVLCNEKQRPCWQLLLPGSAFKTFKHHPPPFVLLNGNSFWETWEGVFHQALVIYGVARRVEGRHQRREGQPLHSRLFQEWCVAGEGGRPEPLASITSCISSICGVRMGRRLALFDWQWGTHLRSLRTGVLRVNWFEK